MPGSREIPGLFFSCIRIDSPIGGRGVIGEARPLHPIPINFFVVFF